MIREKETKLYRRSRKAEQAIRKFLKVLRFLKSNKNKHNNFHAFTWPSGLAPAGFETSTQRMERLKEENRCRAIMFGMHW